MIVATSPHSAQLASLHCAPPTGATIDTQSIGGIMMNNAMLKVRVSEELKAAIRELSDNNGERADNIDDFWKGIFK
ncbi:hypothetical protein SOASR030_02650 [Leminorella grimontii]|uniref:Uncharacterized protein n=1 Tax=Leminorella grimontii TaxID=82981 RepID=A0AAV5MY07_9GAMM|nr:hypothetical protein SOASR030_02650 [Leminorella grimontii]VFS59917.1 Uncharacterised protein [Leminorella grimontii]